MKDWGMLIDVILGHVNWYKTGPC